MRVSPIIDTVSSSRGNVRASSVLVVFCAGAIENADLVWIRLTLLRQWGHACGAVVSVMDGVGCSVGFEC